MSARHTRVLAELTELGLDLARSLKARAEAATTQAEAEGLALAFHRITRSVSLTLALESKLARERAGIANEERGDVRRAVVARQAQVRAPVARDVWSEREQDEAEALMEVLEDHLDEAALYPSFLEDPVEAQVAWLRAQLGLPVNDAGPPSFATPPPAEAPAAEAPAEPPRASSSGQARPDPGAHAELQIGASPHGSPGSRSRATEG